MIWCVCLWDRTLGKSLLSNREYLQRRLESIGFRVLPGQVGCLCSKPALLFATIPKAQELFRPQCFVCQQCVCHQLHAISPIQMRPYILTGGSTKPARSGHVVCVRFVLVNKSPASVCASSPLNCHCKSKAPDRSD